jgi:hypothetical protein
MPFYSRKEFGEYNGNHLEQIEKVACRNLAPVVQKWENVNLIYTSKNQTNNLSMKMKNTEHLTSNKYPHFLTLRTTIKKE